MPLPPLLELAEAQEPLELLEREAQAVLVLVQQLLGLLGLVRFATAERETSLEHGSCGKVFVGLSTVPFCLPCSLNPPPPSVSSWGPCVPSRCTSLLVHGAPISLSLQMYSMIFCYTSPHFCPSLLLHATNGHGLVTNAFAFPPILGLCISFPLTPKSNHYLFYFKLNTFFISASSYLQTPHSFLPSVRVLPPRADPT